MLECNAASWPSASITSVQQSYYGVGNITKWSLVARQSYIIQPSRQWFLNATTRSGYLVPGKAGAALLISFFISSSWISFWSWRVASKGVGLAASFRPERGGGVSMVACPVEGCGNVAAPTVAGVSAIVRLFGTAPDSDGMDLLSMKTFPAKAVGGDSWDALNSTFSSIDGSIFHS